MKKADKSKFILAFVLAIIMLASFILACLVEEQRLSAFILIFGTVFLPLAVFFTQIYWVRFKKK